MNIAVFGSGFLMKQLISSILSAGHTITALGTNPGMNIDDLGFKEIGINPIIIQDYHHACELPIDLVLLYSFAPLIDQESLDKKPFINIHYALLPRFRGFHGFIWSMINGEEKMGYTVHKVDVGIDSGDIYFQYAIEVDECMNINDVRTILDQHLTENIGEYLTLIESKHQQSVPQDESQAIYVTRRKPEDGQIDWTWTSRQISNFIRALTPPTTPGAFTFFKGEILIITHATFLDTPSYFFTAGKVAAFDGNSVLVKCGDKMLKVIEVIYHEKICYPAEIIKSVGIQLGV